MRETEKALEQIIRDLTAKSKSAKNFAELEEEVFQAVQKFGRTALEGYGDELVQRTSQGVKKNCPDCKKIAYLEKRQASLKSLWGEVKLTRHRMRCRSCGKSRSGYLDESLDESGTTPKLLRRMQYLSEEMSYLRAERYLLECEIGISSSCIASVSETYEAKQNELVSAKLQSLETTPLCQSKAAERVWMLEVDGMMVPTRPEANTLEGKAEYKEVKSALLYLKNTPSERYQISSLENCHKFAPLVHGMIRLSGVRQNDVIVGLGDGARWITTLFGDIGVDKHILDVYHASSYFEIVMLAMDYSQEKREQERKKLLSGEFNMQFWLNQHMTPQAREKILIAKNVTTQAGLSRSPKEALHYLEQQAMLKRMDYLDFKTQGFEVIGSGEIEGANKNVLASRLRVSGARWGNGGQGKVMARAMSACVRPVFDFDSVRLSAFPKPW